MGIDKINPISQIPPTGDSHEKPKQNQSPEKKDSQSDFDKILDEKMKEEEPKDENINAPESASKPSEIEIHKIKPNFNKESFSKMVEDILKKDKK